MIPSFFCLRVLSLFLLFLVPARSDFSGRKKKKSGQKKKVYRVSTKVDRGGTMPTPLFFPENSGFSQGSGVHGDPREKWGLEVVDDPPWSCDQSIWHVVAGQVVEFILG